MDPLSTSDFWWYMTPHLGAAGLAVFCSIESYLVWKGNQDPYLGPMDHQRPFVTFWSLIMGIPIYMIVNVITSISGPVRYGLPYYKSVPGVLGLTTTALGLGLIFNQQIINLFNRIFGRNKKNVNQTGEQDAEPQNQ